MTVNLYDPYPINGVLDNSYVQRVFDDALTTLAHADVPENTDMRSRFYMLYYTLEQGMRFSESGNQYPGLGGLGLHELLSLAQRVIDGEFDFKRVPINFKHAAKMFV